MKKALAFFMVLGFCSVCNAEMVSVTPHTADLLSQPGGKYTYTLLKAPQYYPFHVLEENGNYLKVRDYEGLVGWITKSDVANDKSIVIIRDRVNIRKRPALTSPVILRADRGVAFKVLAEQEEWLNIIHDSGQQGWIHKSLTWGYGQ